MNISAQFSEEEWWKHEKEISFLSHHISYLLPALSIHLPLCRFLAVVALLSRSQIDEDKLFFSSLLHIAFMILFINCSLIAITHTTGRFISSSLCAHQYSSSCHRYDDLCPLNRVHFPLSASLISAFSSCYLWPPTCHQAHYHRGEVVPLSLSLSILRFLLAS